MPKTQDDSKKKKRRTEEEKQEARIEFLQEELAKKRRNLAKWKEEFRLDQKVLARRKQMPDFEVTPLMKTALGQLPMPKHIRESPKIQEWIRILEEKHLGESRAERKYRLECEWYDLDVKWGAIDAKLAAAEEEEIPF